MKPRLLDLFCGAGGAVTGSSTTTASKTSSSAPAFTRKAQALRISWRSPEKFFAFTASALRPECAQLLAHITQEVAA